MPNPFAAFGGNSGGSFGGNLGGLNMDPNAMSSMLQNPGVQNMMQQMFSNPEVMNQVFEEFYISI